MVVKGDLADFSNQTGRVGAGYALPPLSDKYRLFANKCRLFQNKGGLFANKGGLFANKAGLSL